MSAADILIVGAGPVGLTLGIELLRHGVSCRVVEQCEKAHHQSRATDIHARTLEAFYDMGVDREIIARGHRRHLLRLHVDGRLVGENRIDGQDTPFSFDLGLPQCDIESVLEARFESLGGKVERGVRLACMSQDASGVTGTLLYPGGRWKEERHAWLVACDGARSAVRRSLEVLLEGSTFDEAFFLVDSELDTPLSPDALSVFISARGSVCFLPMPGQRAFRIFGELDLASPIPSALETSFVQDIVDRRAGAGHAIRAIGWSSLFRVHTRMVKQYRYGRIFLAGDAAHIHSPMGGHGMNTGIQDAYNLGWKLALAARGAAKDALLDTYAPERIPIARAILDETDSLTRMMLTRGALAREVLSRALPLLTKLPPSRRRSVEQALELNVSYRDSPHVEEHLTSVLDATLFSDKQSEHASLVERSDFVHGPQPGDHAPDVKLTNGPCASMHELLRGTRHTLLLFDGDAATDAGYDAFDELVQRVTAVWGPLVDCHVLVPGAKRPPRLRESISVVLDPEKLAHRRYGAAKECAYLVRPDGYIGFRAQPARADAIVSYLDRWLTSA
jgi:2-polyprenyl-6-methoxyphenol hydroxylase-like FAD-dependent oxidoreductase